MTDPTQTGTPAPTPTPRGLPAVLRKYAIHIGLGACALVVGAFNDTARAAISSRLAPLFGQTLVECDLRWSPVDCPNGNARPPGIQLCGCQEKEWRSLDWFTKQLRALKTDGVPGFDGLEDDMVLEADGTANNGLSIKNPSGGAPEWRFGVGYSRAKDSNDGCLRLYRSAKVLVLKPPILCLDTSNRWWTKDGEDAAPMRTAFKLAPTN